MTNDSAVRAHALDVDHLVRELGIDTRHGLTGAEVLERRRRFGANVLPQVRGRSAGRILIDQFLNVIVLLLATAAAISWMTGDVADAIAIVIVLLLNAAIGFAMEWNANRALDALRKQTRITARVRRNGTDQTVAADDLVTGDIVLLSAGDRVPADLRVLEAAALRAEESPLTGESKSVFKSADVVALDSAVAERSSMLFLGTVITSGRAVSTVVAVGERTELGKIGSLVMEAPKQLTPLQRRLDALGRRLVWLVIAAAAIVAFTGWLRGEALWLMIETGISLAVAAVPEALPAVTTFILAHGVLRMARRNAIVRRLSAVETLGSTTVICSDKTGTLTTNHMTVTEFGLPDSGAENLTRLLKVAALCNDATETSGDPTEIALVEAAVRRGINVQTLRDEYPRIAEHPFDPRTKRMITIHRTATGDYRWALKGAPSVVLESSENTSELRSLNASLAGRGLRVLAVAEKKTTSPLGDLDGGFTFLGFIGMLDPPRPGVRDAIASARRAGIRSIMLTGDQIETARSIARDLNLTSDEPRVVHARELQKSDALRLVRTTDVFARVSPEDKYRIVEALQNEGEIVAVTGDGINDAPALKRADIGVAMGNRGTEVAKEAADIVLADDDFSTIVAAIAGGRAIYDNIVKFVHAMFSHNLGEVLTIFVAIALGWPLPLIPLQILWLNLVTDVFPAFALALEPASSDTMERPPRPPDESLLSWRFLGLIGWQGAMLATIALAAYAFALKTYGEGDHARTVALLALVGTQIGQTFNCRSMTKSAWHGLLRNPHIWFATTTVMGVQLAAFWIEPLSRILRLVQPTAADWFIVLLTIVLTVGVVEVQKAVARR